MDSKLYYGVPLSTTQGSPPSQIKGIRAPLTIDDSDYVQKYNSSDTDFESERGFVSGEDEFDTVSEKGLLDYINLEYVVSRPFVRTPDDEIVSSVGDYDDSMSSLTDPCGENGVTDGYSVRPFVAVREVDEGHDSTDEYSDRHIDEYSDRVIDDSRSSLTDPFDENDVADEFTVRPFVADGEAVEGHDSTDGYSDRPIDDSTSSLAEPCDENGVADEYSVRPFVAVREVVEGHDSTHEYSDSPIDDSRSSLTDPCDKNVVTKEVVEGHDNTDEYSDRPIDDSRSSLTNPSDENDVADEFSVRPFVADREVVEGHDSTDEYSDRPIDEYSDGAFTLDGTSMEEGSDKNTSFAGTTVVDNAVRGIPVAQLSYDVLERLDSAPEGKVSDVSDDEEDKTEFGNVMLYGMTEDLILTGNVKMVMGSDSIEQDKAEIDAVQNSINEGDSTDDTFGRRHGVSRKETILLGQELVNDAKVVAETSQIRDNSAEAKSEYSFSDIEPSDIIYENAREQNGVSSFGADDLNCGNKSWSMKIEESEVESSEAAEISEPPAAEAQVYSSTSSLSEVTWSSKLEEDPPKVSDKTQHTEACLNADLETNCADTGPVKLVKNEVVPLLYENDEEVYQDHLPQVDGEIVTDSEEEVETDEEDEEKEIFDAESPVALLGAAAGVVPNGRNVTIPLANGERVFPPEQPASSGSMFRYSDRLTQSENKIEVVSEGILSEDEKKKLEKLQQLRVKYLRLLHRLNRSPEESVAAQVLYRLVRAAGKSALEASSIGSAQKEAMELEAKDTDSLNFSLNILVIGKTGVGKSAMINSIFGESRATVDAFVPSTTNVKEITGQLDGVTLRILDTPGLRSSLLEQSVNRRTLLSINKYMKKCAPDVVLYVDRIDMPSRDLGDLPLLKSISSSLGPSIWRDAIIALTHASTSPPDGPSGYPVSYETFVAQRSGNIQQLINQSVGGLNTMNATPFSLVENHHLSPKNEKGEILLPNGENWRSQLLLWCYSMKILSEIESVMKDKAHLDDKNLFGFPIHSPPLPYFLSSLLESNVHPQVSNNQYGGVDIDSDIELTYSSDSDEEVKEEYDDLPPFKPLMKSQIARLSKEQKRAYFDEYDYGVMLLQKKRWREEFKRLRDLKKNKGKEEIVDYIKDGTDQETGVAIPLADMALPNSFDGDNPAYRYRSLEPSSHLLARPVMDSNGWDHDCGYDGVSIEDRQAIIAGQFPAVIGLQLTKDKKEFNIHLDSSVSAKTGEKGSSMVGFDIQTAGKQLAYILKGETKVRNLKKNKSAAGVSVTFLGDNLVTGLKLEDQFAIGKQLVVVGSTGTAWSRGNAAYGANLELRLREKDYPVVQDQSTFSLSLMKWRSDFIWGCNLQSQFSVGRNSKMAVRARLNSKKSGQITVRICTSDQLQIATFGVLPIARAIMRAFFPQTSE